MQNKGRDVDDDKQEHLKEVVDKKAEMELVVVELEIVEDEAF